MRPIHLFTFLLASSICATTMPAVAGVNVSLQTAAYSFLSYDTSGNPIANDVHTTGTDGYNNATDVGYWTATTSFNLTSTNDTLSISDLSADDRVVVELNGTPIAGAGIYGPGTGVFNFAPSRSQTAYTFLGNGAQSISVTAPFVDGTNTIELIVNNSNNGIYQNLQEGPTAVFFSGTVTPNAVPEPVSGTLLVSGLIGVAAVVRRRGR